MESASNVWGLKSCWCCRARGCRNLAVPQRSGSTALAGPERPAESRLTEGPGARQKLLERSLFERLPRAWRAKHAFDSVTGRTMRTSVPTGDPLHRADAVADPADPAWLELAPAAGHRGDDLSAGHCADVLGNRDIGIGRDQDDRQPEVLETVGQIVMRPAGEVLWGGADDQLVELPVGDGAVHGLEGIIPAVQGGHVAAGGASHQLERDLLSPVVAISVFRRDEQSEARSRAGPLGD